MCPDRLSLVGAMLKGMEREAESVWPGHGCELLHALAAVGDASFLLGFVVGLFSVWIGYECFSACVRKIRKARNAN